MQGLSREWAVLPQKNPTPRSSRAFTHISHGCWRWGREKPNPKKPQANPTTQGLTRSTLSWTRPVAVTRPPNTSSANIEQLKTSALWNPHGLLTSCCAKYGHGNGMAPSTALPGSGFCSALDTTESSKAKNLTPSKSMDKITCSSCCYFASK